MTTFQRVIKYFAIGLAFFIISVIVSSILGVFGFITMFTDDSDERENISSVIEESAQITSIDIDIASTNLEVRVGDEFKVEKQNTSKHTSIKTHGSTLKITDSSNVFWNRKGSGTIVVYIPRDKVLKEVDVDLGAGKVTLDGISSAKLELEQGAGAVFINTSRFDKAKIDGGAGKLEVMNSTLQNLDLEVGVGKTSISGYLLGNSKIEGGVGSLDLNLYGSREDYTIKTEEGLGSIVIDGEKISGLTGSGPNYVSVEGALGSVSVSFENR